jgi:hypothetical protein
LRLNAAKIAKKPPKTTLTSFNRTKAAFGDSQRATPLSHPTDNTLRDIIALRKASSEPATG